MWEKPFLNSYLYSGFLFYIRSFYYLFIYSLLWSQMTPVVVSRNECDGVPGCDNVTIKEGPEKYT